MKSQLISFIAEIKGHLIYCDLVCRQVKGGRINGSQGLDRLEKELKGMMEIVEGAETAIKDNTVYQAKEYEPWWNGIV